MRKRPVLRFILGTAFILIFIWSLSVTLQEKYECEYCWKSVSDEMQIIVVDDIVVCSSCLTGDFYRCLECGRYRSIGDGYNTDLGLCDSCSPIPWRICSECDNYYPDYQCANYNNEYHCIDCMAAHLS